MKQRAFLVRAKKIFCEEELIRLLKRSYFYDKKSSFFMYLGYIKCSSKLYIKNSSLNEIGYKEIKYRILSGEYERNFYYGYARCLYDNDKISKSEYINLLPFETKQVESEMEE